MDRTTDELEDVQHPLLQRPPVKQPPKKSHRNQEPTTKNQPQLGTSGFAVERG